MSQITSDFEFYVNALVDDVEGLIQGGKPSQDSYCVRVGLIFKDATLSLRGEVSDNEITRLVIVEDSTGIEAASVEPWGERDQDAVDVLSGELDGWEPSL